METFVTYLDSLYNYQFFGNSVQTLSITFIWFVGLIIFFRIMRNFVLARFAKLAKKTESDFDDRIIEIISNISRAFYWFLAFFIAIRFSQIQAPHLKSIFYGIFIVMFAYEGIRIVQALIHYGLEQWNKDTKKALDETTMHAVTMVVNLVMWVTAVLLVLSNLGFNISALVASLGVGGIAVALAAQNILGDLFSSFSIFIDRPFQVGDFIVVGSDKGTVRRIGLKTTRIQTLQGEELVVSNKELTNARVQNFKKMKRRRIGFSFGVTYDTPVAKLKKIPELVKEIIDKQELAECDRIHFHTFGDSALIFEIIYYINSQNYLDYMDAQQQMNLQIMELFEKYKIEMAYPTQTIYLKK